jgi:polyisoprenoid-binding protein YceI
MKNLLTSAFLIACTVQAALATVLPRNAGIVVVAHGPAGLRIEGRSAEVSVDDETSALVFRVPVAPIDTGIGLRNRHLREALEADRFPVATLHISRAGLKLPSEAAPLIDGLATGDLSLHGQTRAVSVHYLARRDSSVIHVKATLRLDMREFGIETTSYLGVGVAPEVEVEAELAVELP